MAQAMNWMMDMLQRQQNLFEQQHLQLQKYME